MRKTMLYILTAAMALSITACGAKENETQPAETTAAVETTVEETTEAETTEEETSEEETTEEETSEAASEESSESETAEVVEFETEESTEAADNSNTGDTAVSGESVAQTLLADFNAQLAANSALSAQELADTLLTNSVIQFMGGSVPVEPGLLSGFGNAEITGFEEGVMFAPMIGSIPFVGYVFDLADGTDAAAFVKTLEDNADRRWNICVEADETVVELNGDKVFFVMSPLSFEE
ncbi:MAG: hypothetical protein IJO55_10370 [Lachnospiraceae bacterium]|nr:hypothetical protein [Lachnospiraceae bacterium]